jgi:hypothetical protein
VSSKLKARQADLPREIVELAWRTQLRLHARYRHLSSRIGSLKALTAIARELAGFIWAAVRVTAQSRQVSSSTRFARQVLATHSRHPCDSPADIASDTESVGKSSQGVVQCIRS